MTSSCSDHARIHVRIGRVLELTLQLFSANFSLILECTFAWQPQYWVDSRSAKCCNFQYKMRLRSAKSNLGERAGAR